MTRAELANDGDHLATSKALNEAAVVGLLHSLISSKLDSSLSHLNVKTIDVEISCCCFARPGIRVVNILHRVTDYL